MKKLLSALLVAGLVATLLLVSCTNNNSDNQESTGSSAGNYDCSITRLSVEESDNGQIGYNFLFGNGAC